GGRIRSDRVAAFDRNRWPPSVGIGGRFAPDSAQGLAITHYKPEQLEGWMGERTAKYYEDVIAAGTTIIAEQNGEVLGFVDSVPGEVTRLFVLPKASGRGIGERLLKAGLEAAAKEHPGPIKIESTLNAQRFYERHGFRAIQKGYFSHGLGGDPIEIVLMEMAR
ncbi:GNAT family N-acetyltransferase, partial [Bradyrhizobium sp. 174]|uniref:GNAT family N-acetyltransferase n=1 Tax=Bradyrhizobium sp. 174 TaxID=2782645 RepID=UPI00201C5931